MGRDCNRGRDSSSRGRDSSRNFDTPDSIVRYKAAFVRRFLSCSLDCSDSRLNGFGNLDFRGDLNAIHVNRCSHRLDVDHIPDGLVENGSIWGTKKVGAGRLDVAVLPRAVDVGPDRAVTERLKELAFLPAHSKRWKNFIQTFWMF